MNFIDALEQTFDHAHGVIAGVRVDQYDDQTPCAEWSVRDLLDHMVGVVAGLGSAVGGNEPVPFELGDDPAAHFEAAAAAAMQTWRQPDVLDAIIDAGPGPMPGRVVAGTNLLDNATHSWISPR